MSRHLISLGQMLLLPLHIYIRRKRRIRRGYASMSHEQLQELLRMRRELQAVKDRQREFLAVHRPPGAMF